MKRILIVILFINLATALAKTIWGLISHSISMQADGVHSFLDATSNVTGYIGVWIASQPPDAEHPYGHRKFETFASFCISVFLFFGCFKVLQNSFLRFQDGSALKVTTTSFAIMAITLGINIFLTRWEKREGERLRSEVLIADSFHTKSDIYVSLSVIGSLFAGWLGYPMLDPLVSIVIAGVIGKVGWDILLESSKVLTDYSRIDSKEIKTLVMKMAGVEACHAIRTRGSLNYVHVDLHIHVSPKMSIEAAHEIAHEVEAEIMDHFSEVAEVIVHLEPHIPNLKND